MIYRRINEVFEYNGLKIRIVVWHRSCENCVFRNSSTCTNIRKGFLFIDPCIARYRKDIKFIKHDA